jgi:hypothetical protein
MNGRQIVPILFVFFSGSTTHATHSSQTAVEKQSETENNAMRKRKRNETPNKDFCLQHQGAKFRQ